VGLLRADYRDCAVCPAAHTFLSTMSSPEDPPHICKGKSREHTADPSERTPLLASQSHSSQDDPDLETTSRSRRRLWSRLISIFLVTLSICKLNRCFVLRCLTISISHHCSHRRRAARPFLCCAGKTGFL
jgi:hypothetical protein